jgi:hypothetical protein
LYSSPNIITVIKTRRMRWTGHVVLTWDIRNAYNILIGKSERKRQLRKRRRRCEDNIKMYVRERGWAVSD